ncbi:hypothetical protein KY328_04730 [Candidatus Woesearchaeota archaeon]|nr:hypothetical protein [Candidatus Woesearchaeota archaeon]MBW3022203.1 hypothetical protein [Candidatus Woesearchaeota archaeon]
MKLDDLKVFTKYGFQVRYSPNRLYACLDRGETFVMPETSLADSVNKFEVIVHPKKGTEFNVLRTIVDIFSKYRDLSVRFRLKRFLSHEKSHERIIIPVNGLIRTCWYVRCLFSLDAEASDEPLVYATKHTDLVFSREGTSFLRSHYANSLDEHFYGEDYSRIRIKKKS